MYKLVIYSNVYQDARLNNKISARLVIEIWGVSRYPPRNYSPHHYMLTMMAGIRYMATNLGGIIEFLINLNMDTKKD